MAFVASLTAQDRVRVAVNAVRSAASARRTTSFAQVHGMSAVQLEIDAALRPPTGTGDRRQHLVEALAAGIASTGASTGNARTGTARTVCAGTTIPVRGASPRRLRTGLRHRHRPRRQDFCETTTPRGKEFRAMLRFDIRRRGGSRRVPVVARSAPPLTKALVRLYEQGRLQNVAYLEVEAQYGYLARIVYTDGSCRFTYGTDLGVNPSTAAHAARDKAHTKVLLRSMGVACPDGAEFLLPWWAHDLNSMGRAEPGTRTTDTIGQFAAQLGYPVYVKPVDGTGGVDVHQVHHTGQLPAIIEGFERRRVRVAVVEESIDLPDHRVIVHDGHLVGAFRRTPLTVTGDGHRTVRDLFEQYRATLLAGGKRINVTGDDPRITATLADQGLELADRPPAGVDVRLLPTAGLSSGGTMTDVTDVIHPRWVRLACDIARHFGLRMCGIDLMCQDITDPHAAYSVLEINAAPEVSPFATLGTAWQAALDDMYVAILDHPRDDLNSSPGTADQPAGTGTIQDEQIGHPASEQPAAPGRLGSEG